MRAAAWMTLLLASFTLLAACGGGGGGSTSSSGNSNAAAPEPPAPLSGANAHRVTVKAFGGAGSGTANTLLTSVTVCSPTTNVCQTIDDVLLDTGSTGLRIFESAVNPQVSLTPQTTGGNTVSECINFADGSLLWGPVKNANVVLANQTATNIPIQLISTSAPPVACSGVQPNTPTELGANGILGIGALVRDCGDFCAFNPNNATYFRCNNAGFCTSTALPLSQQVRNPVSAFPTHNSGNVIRLPAVSLPGLTELGGELVLGINTAANNTLGSAKRFPVDTFSTLYRGTVHDANIDSGTSALFFDDTLPLCQGSNTYCPPAATARSAINMGLNNLQDTVNFTIIAPENLAVQPGLGAATSALSFGFANNFLWGLPFFYGRSIFTALEGTALTAAAGAFYAY